MLLPDSSALVCLASLSVAVASAISRYRNREDDRPKMVLITGAAQGLGRAMVLELIKRGDFVVGSDVNSEGLQTLEIEYPRSFLALPMNVTDMKSVCEAAGRLFKYSGKPCLDAIVNNAGLMKGGPLIEIEDSSFVSIISVNILGTFFTTKYFFPLLKRGSTDFYKPRVINLGSEVSYAQMAPMFITPYSITKFGVEAYSVGLRQELAVLDDPVYVTIICPGAHQTSMTDKSNDHMGAQIHGKSIYGNKLTLGNAIANKYMTLHVQPASAVGEAVAKIVHLIHPPTRKKVNVSLEMELARFVPQCILDFFLVSGLKASSSGT